MFSIFNITRIIAALIMLQTLRFKFTGHPESVEIFSAIGMEPHGRIIVGVLELIAAILLFTRFSRLGGLLTIGLMAGAIFFHIIKLGPGPLLWMAIITLLCGLYIVRNQRAQIPLLNISNQTRIAVNYN